MTPAARRAALLVASLAVAGALLYLSLAEVDLRQVWKGLAQASLPLLALSVLVRVLALGLAAERSRILLAPLHRFGRYRLFKSLLLAFVVQNVVPFRAGEVARVGYLSRFGKLSASSCLAVVATERLVDLFVLLALFIAVLPAVAIDLPVGATLYGGCAVAAGAVLAAVVVSRHPERFVRLCRTLGSLLGPSVGGFVEGKSENFARGLAALGSAGSVIAAVLLSAVYWLGSAVTLHLWMRAIDLDLGWQAPVVVLAFLSLGLAVPTTPGNIGTYHLLAFAAMTRLGVGEVEAGSFALLSHAMSVVPATVIGVSLLFRDLYRPRGSAPA